MLHQTEANVSRQLQAMKKAGLVSIIRNKSDRRVREVTLTSKGTSTFKRAEAALDRHYHKTEPVALADMLRLLA
jgi:DNA-binding MarR family transcriptional regulator